MQSKSNSSKPSEKGRYQSREKNRRTISWLRLIVWYVDERSLWLMLTPLTPKNRYRTQLKNPWLTITNTRRISWPIFWQKYTDTCHTLSREKISWKLEEGSSSPPRDNHWPFWCPRLKNTFEVIFSYGPSLNHPIFPTASWSTVVPVYYVAWKPSYTDYTGFQYDSRWKWSRTCFAMNDMRMVSDYNAVDWKNPLQVFKRFSSSITCGKCPCIFAKR